MMYKMKTKKEIKDLIKKIKGTNKITRKCILDRVKNREYSELQIFLLEEEYNLGAISVLEYIFDKNNYWDFLYELDI